MQADAAQSSSIQVTAINAQLGEANRTALAWKNRATEHFDKVQQLEKELRDKNAEFEILTQQEATMRDTSLTLAADLAKTTELLAPGQFQQKALVKCFIRIRK